MPSRHISVKRSDVELFKSFNSTAPGITMRYTTSYGLKNKKKILMLAVQLLWIL